jgi:hypothetical protein
MGFSGFNRRSGRRGEALTLMPPLSQGLQLTLYPRLHRRIFTFDFQFTKALFEVKSLFLNESLGIERQLYGFRLEPSPRVAQGFLWFVIILGLGLFT